jgi:uncharacterized protein (DUF1330 family)
MSCYVIYHYNILDNERIDELGPLSLPIVKKFGGELVVASAITFLEGHSPYDGMVAYKFENIEIAKNFYESEDSRELSKLRNEITEGFAVLVPEYIALK